MIFGEKRFVAFLADKVSAALVRVHVLLQVVGLEEVFVALWTLYSPFTTKQEDRGWNEEEVGGVRKPRMLKATYCVWENMCCFRSCFLMKARSQRSHLSFSAPVWMSIWDATCDFWVNNLSQMEHL